MFLTDEDINEFIQIYKEEFGEDIPFAEASRMAEGLMEFFVILAEDEDASLPSDPGK